MASTPLFLGCRIFCSLLLHGLMFCKAQTHSLRHFDVPFGAMFGAGYFALVQCFGSKSIDARVEASHYHVVIHTEGIQENKD
jgi:hypothetical protein